MADPVNEQVILCPECFTDECLRLSALMWGADSHFSCGGWRLSITATIPLVGIRPVSLQLPHFKSLVAVLPHAESRGRHMTPGSRLPAQTDHLGCGCLDVKDMVAKNRWKKSRSPHTAWKVSPARLSRSIVRKTVAARRLAKQAQ